MNVKEGELAEGRVKEGREEGKNGMKERKKEDRPRLVLLYCSMLN